MADPNPGGNVYKRGAQGIPGDLHEKWNAVIEKVNDERQNQPSLPDDSDCDPLEAIAYVEENHIWTKQDVEDVRTAIDDMCPFAWTKDLEYWKDEIITEIEDALDRDYGGWGDEDECCTVEECFYECPNARGHGDERRDEYYLGRWYNNLIFWTQHENDTCNPESPLEVMGHYDLCNHYLFGLTDELLAYYACVGDANAHRNTASSRAGSALSAKMGAFPFGKERDRYDEKVIPPLETKRDAAQSAKDAACNQVPPNPAECAAATEYLEQCQAELDEATAQRDYYDDQYNTRLDEAQAYAEECETELDAYHAGLSACIGMLTSEQQSVLIRSWELAGSITAPWWETYSLENYKANKLYYNCRPYWGMKSKEGDPCGGQPIAPISGRAIGLGYTSMPYYGYITIHKPAGECWWPWPPPHWYPVEEETVCYICMCKSGTPPGCWSSFCDDPPCSIADYEAMYVEWWFCIVWPQSYEEYCPE